MACNRDCGYIIENILNTLFIVEYIIYSIYHICQKVLSCKHQTNSRILNAGLNILTFIEIYVISLEII